MNNILLIALIVLLVIMLVWVNPSGMLNTPKSYLVSYGSKYVPMIMPLFYSIPSMEPKIDIIVQSGGSNSGVATIVNIGDKNYDIELNNRGTNVLDVAGDGTLVKVASFDTCCPDDPLDMTNQLLTYLKSPVVGSVYRFVVVFDEAAHARDTEGVQVVYDEIAKILPKFNTMGWRVSYVAAFKFGKLIESKLETGAATFTVNA